MHRSPGSKSLGSSPYVAGGHPNVPREPISIIIQSFQIACLPVSHSYAIVAFPELDPDERPGTDDTLSLYQRGIVSLAKHSKPTSTRTSLRQHQTSNFPVGSRVKNRGTFPLVPGLQLPHRLQGTSLSMTFFVTQV
jgi:hypothetical protein